VTVQGDMLIRGGVVVDPARGYFDKADILVRGNVIAGLVASDTIEAAKVIDASGCLVLPGLIDYHAHLFHGGTEIGIYPDSALLPQGVTTAVDQGSAGIANCDSFFDTVVSHSQVRIFANLHVSPAGLTTTRHPEPVDPKIFDLDLSRSLIQKQSGRLLGLKIRQSKRIVGNLGLEPLRATVQMADAIGCRVVVHTTDPPSTTEDLASILRSGDVYTHMYQGNGSTIVSDKGKVFQGIQAARNRGVLFDTADGRVHYAFSIAKAALADGFEPDIISSDVTKASLFERSVFGLPLIMSKYLNLGLSLQSVVKACTATPACLIGMQGKLGTLAPGSYADIAIFELKQKPMQLQDPFGETLSCNQAFISKMTILNGRIAYRDLGF